MAVKSGYEGIYEWVCGQLANADLAACAPHLGLEVLAGGRVRVDFFGREYLVDKQGVTAADGLPVRVNHLSLVGHYAMSPGRGEAGGEFVPMGRLSGALEGCGSYERSRSRELDRKFGANVEALRQRAASLGGVEVAGDASGGLAWIFHPFPKVPIKLVHHPADEEFEAAYQLLFDSSATAFMVFEALGFLSGVFVYEMTSGYL